jgi:hypothetical protein
VLTQETTLQKVMTIPKMPHNFFVEYMTRRRNRLTRRNKNWLCIEVGGTGDGKSWSAGRQCSFIDPQFINNIREYGIHSVVAFGKAQDYLKMVDQGIEDHILKRGSMCMFDEAGVGVPARDWYKNQNKDFSYVAQTFRSLNIGTIFTTPDISFIDSQPRKLFHDYQEARGVDMVRKLTLVKPMIMQNNPKMGKIYYKWPRFHGIVCKKLWMCKPNQLFIDEYEPAKEEFNRTLRKESIKTGEKDAKTKADRKMTDDERLERLEAANINVNDTQRACAFLECSEKMIARLKERKILREMGIIK